MRLLLLLATLLLPTLVKAQTIDYYDVLVHNARAVVSDGSNVPVDRSNTVVIEVSGTGTFDVLFRISGPGVFGWQPLYCTTSDQASAGTDTTENGLFTCNVAGGEAVSARLDTCTGCSVSVSVRRTTAVLGGGGGSGGAAGLSAVLAVDRIDGDAINEASALAVGSTAADAYMVTFYDPTDGLIHTCKVSGTLNNCDKVIKLLSGKKFTVKNSTGTEIFTVSESGAITNATLNAESTGNTITLKRYKWFPAAGCNNATASTIWDLPTSNPAVAACRTGTNTTKGVLEFADGSDLSAQLTEYLFEDWTGAIDATIIYEANSTSTNNTVWQLAIACAGDADSDDPAFTYDEFTADAGKATAHQYNATASNTITTTGTCAAGDIMHIAVRRNSAHASDNLAATAKLVGVALKLREAQ